MIKAMSLIAGLWLGSALWGAQWTLTDSDLQRRDGTLKSLDHSGARFQTSSTALVPWQQIVSLEQSVVPAARSGDDFILRTRDGQSLSGQPVSIGDEQLLWKGTATKEVRVRLEDVLGFSRADSPLPPPEANEDRAVLKNGDILSGIIGPDKNGITITKGTASTPVAWDALRAVSLAQVGNSSATKSQCRITLADGSVFLAKSIRIDHEQLHMVRSGDELTLPLELVQSIQNEAGKVRFLASLEPTHAEYVPYAAFSSETKRAPVTLDEASADGRVYRNVLQLRPKSVLSYKAPADGAFHARYVPGNAGQYTDMSLRIRVDGKAILDVGSIRATTASQVIEAPVKAGSELRIEVGYSAYYDVQDYLWLLDAAFIQK